MKTKPDHCRLCYRVLAPHDPDRSEDGKYHVSCMKRLERHRLQVMYVMTLILCLALPAFGANQLPPALSCGPQGAMKVPGCEMQHYFGTWRPKWEVYFEGRLVARAEGLTFEPVLDEAWRVIRASLPAHEGKVVFEIEARLNQDSGKAEYRATSREARFEAYQTQKAAVVVADAEPP